MKMFVLVAQEVGRARGVCPASGPQSAGNWQSVQSWHGTHTDTHRHLTAPCSLSDSHSPQRWGAPSWSRPSSWWRASSPTRRTTGQSPSAPSSPRSPALTGRLSVTRSSSSATLNISASSWWFGSTDPTCWLPAIWWWALTLGTACPAATTWGSPTWGRKMPGATPAPSPRTGRPSLWLTLWRYSVMSQPCHSSPRIRGYKNMRRGGEKSRLVNIPIHFLSVWARDCLLSVDLSPSICFH